MNVVETVSGEAGEARRIRAVEPFIAWIASVSEDDWLFTCGPVGALTASEIPGATHRFAAGRLATPYDGDVVPPVVGRGSVAVDFTVSEYEAADLMQALAASVAAGFVPPPRGIASGTYLAVIGSLSMALTYAEHRAARLIDAISQ